jgi:hypothetical protein
MPFCTIVEFEWSAFAERTAAAVAHMPAPSRVVGFDVSAYVVS